MSQADGGFKLNANNSVLISTNKLPTIYSTSLTKHMHNCLEKYLFDSICTNQSTSVGMILVLIGEHVSVE